jgi:multiple sugar transport system permease protein
MAVMSMIKARKLGQKAAPYLLIMPVVIYYIFFWAQPVVKSFVDSFTDAFGHFTFNNYVMVLNDANFLPALRNTSLIVIASVALEFFAALFLALLINRKFRGSSIFLFLAMIPMALPSVAVGAMWKTGLTTNGWLNSFLHYVGLFTGSDKIYWLAGSEWAMLALIIIIDAWQVIPSIMIILLAGLQNIPPESEEAGYVFGGDYLTVLRKITLPLLKPTIQTAVVMRLIAAIQIWLIIIVMLGFTRLPVLVERIVYYHKEVPGLDISAQMASGYTIIVTIIVSVTALVYLKISGSTGQKKKEG